MGDQVFCQFKHIQSKSDANQLVANIKTFVGPKTFDDYGIKECVTRGKKNIQFKLTREETNRLRDRLAQVLPNESSPIWFHIQSDPLNGLDERALHTTVDHRHEGSTFAVSCHFGALRSYSIFYSHVSFKNKVLTLRFQPTRDLPNTLVIEFEQFRITIPFDAIQKKNILVNKTNETNGVFLLIPLSYTPYIYRLEPVKSDGKEKKNPDMKQVRLCVDSRHNFLLDDLEFCSDLVIHFPHAQNMSWAFLRHFLEDRPYRYEINFGNFQILDWSRETNKTRGPDPFNYSKASYEDRYALQMLTSLGYVFRDKWAQLTDQELDWKTCDPKERYGLCCFAVEQLRADHGYDLRRTLEDYTESKRGRKKTDGENGEEIVLAENKQLLKVAVCTLTPMRTIFQPLEVTIGSRALRHPKLGGPKRFLLVHFREEDNGRLSVTNTNIKQRLKDAMNKGITSMGRNYVYIGSSTGQMKEMAFWFFDLPSNIKDASEARHLLGEFDEIKNIATYIARVGQYFSRTLPVGITLTKVASQANIDRKNGVNYVTEIPDIKRGEYCFTDGVGKISWGLAGRVAQKLNLPLSDKKDIPSAFQVRVSGCKGMVTIDPESSLNDYYMLVRESMMKFTGSDWNLEICDYARPIPLTLNNQVIRLLSDIGNDDNVFIALQNQSFHQWEVPEDQQSPGIEIALQKQLSYASSKENLLTNRIPIPPTEGRNMFGVADETGELKYGECFIQYSHFNSTRSGQRRYEVIKGPIIVTKNPCLWPGDFRRLQAVGNKKLEACMRDVIVFPTNGDRPHSNEISGSDLDGDQYWVYWGDKFQIRENFQPLSYKGVDKKKIPLIDQVKIIDHIVESFSAGIILGMIANTHSVVADKHKDHTHSEPCKELAELFALAVDSPKTGQFISKEQIRPYQKEYCKDWPKYMRKFDAPSSDSNSILEKLYKKAAERYRNPNEKLIMGTAPTKRRDAAANPITDAAFEQWLTGKPYEESQEKEKPRKSKIKKADDDIESDDDEEVAPKKPPKPKETLVRKSSVDVTIPLPEGGAPKAQEKKTIKKKTGDTGPVIGKESSDVDKPPSLMNSDFQKCAGASALFVPSQTSTLSSLAPLNSDQSYLDFQIISDPAITAAGNLEFQQIDATWQIVRPKNELVEDSDRGAIVAKLVSCMEKQDILKKNSPAANEALYGSLQLRVFYGHIYFTKQDPQKLSVLRKLVEDKGEQVFRFNYANLAEFDMNYSACSSKKNKFEYELDCRLDSTENITLLFDKNKTLQQIRVYRVWSRTYMRLPNYIVDHLYDIRSVLTYESDSPEFNRITSTIFKGASKGLLTDRKPNVNIDRSLLHSSVILISLKVLDDDQFIDRMPSNTQAFYREVKYVTINERQDKPKSFSTLEYHVIPMNKNKAFLEQICNFAFLPNEHPETSEKSGRSAKASSAASGLRGFSMLNE